MNTTAARLPHSPLRIVAASSTKIIAAVIASSVVEREHLGERLHKAVIISTGKNVPERNTREQEGVVDGRLTSAPSRRSEQHADAVNAYRRDDDLAQESYQTNVEDGVAHQQDRAVEIRLLGELGEGCSRVPIGARDRCCVQSCGEFLCRRSASFEAR